MATCEVPEESLFEPVDWLGVDRGIVNLATTSDADNFQGRGLNRYRRWHARVRSELQARRTKSATRRLKRRARRERRHAAHVNHKIAKQLVAVAERTGRGIAFEDSSGIRDRVTVPRHQRATHSSWPFHQGHLLLSLVRSRWTRRRRRRRERPKPGTVGVGARQRTRTRRRISGGLMRPARHTQWRTENATRLEGSSITLVLQN
ncbi:hypothetical protein GCM10011609_50070 [Lentzea pudingi]|uniref:Probable transposase IS891/IS1136/IS1341 domain-containing protein n=2 Tax=Lentzea pudingi TaxID=1789439 RepID=A0ABQ2ICS7_9PSEU|nr:hypothetical protein GCM10011609_50070 [Lentzea pudingi]